VKCQRGSTSYLASTTGRVTRRNRHTLDLCHTSAGNDWLEGVKKVHDVIESRLGDIQALLAIGATKEDYSWMSWFRCLLQIRHVTVQQQCSIKVDSDACPRESHLMHAPGNPLRPDCAIIRPKRCPLSSKTTNSSFSKRSIALGQCPSGRTKVLYREWASRLVHCIDPPVCLP